MCVAVNKADVIGAALIDWHHPSGKRAGNVEALLLAGVLARSELPDIRQNDVAGRMNTFSLMRRVAIDKKPSGVSTKSSAGNTAKAGENWAPLEIACRYALW